MGRLAALAGTAWFLFHDDEGEKWWTRGANLGVAVVGADRTNVVPAKPPSCLLPVTVWQDLLAPSGQVGVYQARLIRYGAYVPQT